MQSKAKTPAAYLEELPADRRNVVSAIRRELRKNLPRHLAAGYRVQVGNSQWLIYRSLTPAANRTILGQNLMCEMHVSRFLPTGDVEELIEIE